MENYSYSYEFTPYKLVINSANIPAIKAVSAGYFAGETACGDAEIVIRSGQIYMTLPFSHSVVIEEHTIQDINSLEKI